MKFHIVFIPFCFLLSCTQTGEQPTRSNNITRSFDSTQTVILQNSEPQVLEVSQPIFINSKNCIYNSKIDSNYLFKAWVQNPKGPSADFQISSKDFFAVDFEGIGERKYILNNRNIKISDENYTDEGDIVMLTKDSFQIKWKATGITVTYYEWKDNE